MAKPIDTKVFLIMRTSIAKGCPKSYSHQHITNGKVFVTRHESLAKKHVFLKQLSLLLSAIMSNFALIF